ncbi:MAG: 3-dehydroquinate synthase [Planctomyces sp.]|jgi:3-dehydroquinate synthase|nr:3-dehydroquinate synthase [Planctomyces sp.]
MSSQTTCFRTVSVDLGARSYRIEIGSGLLQQAFQYVTAWSASGGDSRLRILVVADAAVLETHAAVLTQSLQAGGIEVHQMQVPSGESSKSWTQLQRIHDALVEFAADRRTVVAAVGGGVTGDLAGFAAATYARGLRFLQVPTTLLSMVDSSVGGKTGINHPRGKNLIGAFHQPVGVLIDQSVLQTLPDREYRAGLAEVVKYGVILDAGFFEYLESSVPGLNSRDPQVLSTVISRSCELKADVVRQDEYETTGLRAVLNYGHTFGHAFEALAGYGQLLHGEAVSIGMICASRLAEKLGRVSAEVTDRQLRLLEALKLPTAVPSELRARPDEIVQCMLLDKKTEGRELRFVLPSRLGHVETVRGVSAELALSVL